MGADHKGPLAAFVVIAIIAAVLLVTSVRSQADEGWLAVHRLITGHRSSTVAGSPVPAGVQHPAPAPASAAPTTTVDDPAQAPASPPQAAQVTAGQADRSAPSPTATGPTSATPGPAHPSGDDPTGAPTEPADPSASPVSGGQSGLPDPIQQALGGDPGEPSPPVSESPTAQPDFGWPFERPHWFLGAWSQRHWLALLGGHRPWAARQWHLHHRWAR